MNRSNLRKVRKGQVWRCKLDKRLFDVTGLECYDSGGRGAKLWRVNGAWRESKRVSSIEFENFMRRLVKIGDPLEAP
jgi:hypothetical protein